jgi:hypothetical protein
MDAAEMVTLRVVASACRRSRLKPKVETQRTTARFNEVDAGVIEQAGVEADGLFRLPREHEHGRHPVVDLDSSSSPADRQPCRSGWSLCRRSNGALEQRSSALIRIRIALTTSVRVKPCPISGGVRASQAHRAGRHW